METNKYRIVKIAGVTILLGAMLFAAYEFGYAQGRIFQLEKDKAERNRY